MSSTASSPSPQYAEPHGSAVLLLSFALAMVINATWVGVAVLFAVNGPLRDLGSVDLIVSEPVGPGVLKLSDSTALAQQISGVASVSPVVAGLEPVSVGSQSVQAEVRGVAPDFPRILAWQTDRGGFFTDQDNAALDRVAVIDQSLERRLFQPNVSAVGESIRIRNIPFTVVGVGSDSQQDNLVLVPFRTGQIRLFGPGSLDEIVLQLASANQARSVTRQVEQLLRMRHQLRPDQRDDFAISNTVISAPDGAANETERAFKLAQQIACQAKNTCPYANATRELN